MSIIERIKKLFKKAEEEQQLLTDGSQTTNTKDEFRKKYRVDQTNIPVEPSLESCFKEYIEQYLLQEEIKPGASMADKSYRAFRRMFCSDEEEIGKNSKNQEDLDNKIRKPGRDKSYQGLQIGNQTGSADRMVYRHIRGIDGITEDESHNGKVEKLYINCDRKNIAQLTGKIIEGIRGIAGDRLTIKYINEPDIKEYKENEAKSQIKNYQRNEKIVIYAENHEKAEMMADAINQIRLENPKLFSRKKIIPLLPKKYGFIGIGKEQPGQHARFPSGIASGKTINDYMADMMLNSVISAFDDYFDQDANISEESNEERLKQYMEVFPQMGDCQQEIIGRCENIFMDVCSKSKVNTVYPPVIDTEKNIDKDNSQRY